MLTLDNRISTVTIGKKGIDLRGLGKQSIEGKRGLVTDTLSRAIPELSQYTADQRPTCQDALAKSAAGTVERKRAINSGLNNAVEGNDSRIPPDFRLSKSSREKDD